VAAAPMRGNMGGKVRVPGVDMSGAKVCATAPAVTATSAAPAMAATASAAFTSATAARSPAFGRERQIGRANGNPEGADTCGKSQDNKLADKPFADRAHDVSFPIKALPFSAQPTRFCGTCSTASATVMLRCTVEEADRGRDHRSIHLVASPPGMAEIGSKTTTRITIMCAAISH
jgi:hypothetical protein